MDWLDEIKERAEKATPGPWTVGSKKLHEGGNTVANDYRIIATRAVYRRDHEFNEKVYRDMEFIAHAKQDIPRLIAEVERLRGLLNGEM